MIENGANLLWRTLIVFVFFLVDWSVIRFDWVRIKPVTKILAMGSIIAWTFVSVDWQFGGFAVLLVVAQVFGLLGDIFLLLRRRWFLWGLGAFLVGHLFYTFLFIYQLLEVFKIRDFSFTSLLWILPVIFCWVMLLIWFYRTYKPVSEKKALWSAIQVYAWNLSGMTALAFVFMIYTSQFKWSSMFLPIGALLFTISDLLLAYNRFIQKIPRGQLWVRITYHLAQLSLAWGFVAIVGMQN
jgi:uncharacterized membrane protein YhhN